MKWLHPVSFEEKVAVDVEVAAVVAIDSLDTQSGHNLPLVKVLVNVAQTWIA